MNWNNKRYHTLNYDLRERFGTKVIKLSLNAGMTCPNRDGAIGERGCLFCGEAGAGEFAGNVHKSITEQIEEQIHRYQEKWPKAKYIAYFQSYTNTYAPVDQLRGLFEEAICYPGVVGLAIATRPDCLGEDVLKLLDDLNQKTFLWLELGLQSKWDKTAQLIRRGYDLAYYLRIHEKLKALGIREVLHLIIGLPGETHAMILESAAFVSGLEIYGVKIHLMHVLKNTDLHQYYESTGFDLLDQESYISYVVDVIERLSEKITIHRVTGDGKKDLLVGPWWSLNKRAVLNGIDKEFKRRDSWQGKACGARD